MALVVLGPTGANGQTTLPDAPAIPDWARVLDDDQTSKDRRLGPLKTLDDHFPFAEVENPAQWFARAESLRRRVRIATGLWPMPEKTPLAPVIHGKVQRDGFSVEKVSFESLPGHHVTGLLFRPSPENATSAVDGRSPGVLSPHGHGGRNQQLSDDELAKQLANGSEHFAKSGRTPKLARCAQLARMGCVTFIFDMLGYGDSIQLSYELAHRHAKARPEESAAEYTSTPSWVFYSTPAELRLQSIMGLQTWNAIRSLDFLASLPDVDATRLAVTGGSGGGTQSILLGAIDDRVSVSFPNGMVSTSMQGGCYCENANYLRIGTGNVELAALFAPKPQAMTAADDWTRDMMTDGYPQLKWLYAMIGDENDVYCRPMLNFPHNYNYVTRATMYQWMNRHLELGLDDPVIEQDFEPLSESELAVWNDQHPPPIQRGIAHERSICDWLDQQAATQLSALEPTDAQTFADYQKVVGAAWATMLGGRAENGLPRSAVRFEQTGASDAGGFAVVRGLVCDDDRGARIPLVQVRASGAEPKGVTIWTSKSGKSDAFDASGRPVEILVELVKSGDSVWLVDLIGQGELGGDWAETGKQRRIADRREYSGLTFGYNSPLAAQRTDDLLAVIELAGIGLAAAPDDLPDELPVRLFGSSGSAAWVAGAAAFAGQQLDDVAIDTGGFRFAGASHFSDADFVPGSVKYGDLPGLLALRAPHAMTILGEPNLPAIVASAYRATSADPPTVATEIDQWISSR